MQIPKQVQIGGLVYTIEFGENLKRLRVDDRYGECSTSEQIIRLDTVWSNQQVTLTFIHECIEAINSLYCEDRMPHQDISCLSQILFQILSQLGVMLEK